MSDGRARLARLGFADPVAAERTLAQLRASASDDLAAVLSAAADPDLALRAFARLPADRRELPGAGRERLVAVLGASAALGDHLARHPADADVLTDPGLTAARPSAIGLRETLLADVAPHLGTRAAADALRRSYRRALLGLAARDLCAGLDVGDVAGELADLAGAALEAGLAIARAETGSEARLAVIGMGKCGGRELNYVSDVDVVFVAEPADSGAEALAAAVMRACSATTPEGTLWPVDAALRPEGRAGPLVRTLASHEAYYRRWAKTWEFQALLKARPVAGDLELGAAYAAATSALVWQAAGRPGFVDDVQAMRRRVEATLPASRASRELKLGPGGLRDVEFAVQLLQLVHGRSDRAIRSGNTLDALCALAAAGYVGREDAGQLDAAYRFLRLLEHRLQLQRLRRTHLLPTDERELRWLARAAGLRADPVRELREEHARHAREVRRLHEKLFYRPLLTAVARLPAEQARLSPAAARARLEALGFADPAAALRHLEALTSGVTRRAAIQRTLLPVMLGWFADAADPDAGLLAFRQVSDALGTTPWYLRLLRDEGAAAERLARLLATSRYAADLLARAPEGVAMLASDMLLTPRPVAEEFRATAARYDDWEPAVAAVRALRREELLRVAAGDLLGVLPLEQVGAALADVTVATLTAALDVATRKIEAERRAPLPARLLVVAMGRLGGGEQGYASDADVLFVHEPVSGVPDDVAAAASHDVANELRRLLALPAPDPPLVVDADLRPEGRSGPLTRSLAGYVRYYARWSAPWETQALLRARPVAGDADLAARFIATVDPIRYPAGGVADATVREIRRIKARMESERLPRGADPALHTKLGRGGLSDVEWVVQLLQLRHAADVPALQTTGTLPALRAATSAGLLAPADAVVLEQAWRLASRVRNAVMLVRGRPSDVVPSAGRELAAAARAIGYPAGSATRLLEDYRRVTRRSRAVVERIFYA
jgi:glutamate-ammonia-ligase adenylyltransferase